MPNRDLWGDSCSRISAILRRLASAVALIGISVCPAHAQYPGSQSAPPPSGQAAPALVAPPTQPVSTPSDLQFLVTPYLWMPWVGVGVNPSNSRIPSASGTVDFGQLLTHMTWVPFMGAAELRDGPFGVVIDYLHAPLRAGITTKNILFSGGTGGLVIDTGTAMFLYRPIAQPDQYLDVGMGVRAWGISGGITLNEGLLPSFAVTSGTAWADPLVGARYHRDLGNGWGATVYGDVGGFGIGAHIDWQVLGTIDYTTSSGIDLHVGFRDISFNDSLKRSNLNVNMYGPILGATFRF
jgi:hypothetical protein